MEIIYEVSNNGTPIDISSIDSLINSNSQKLKGFALRNLNDRLILKYSNANRLTYYIDDSFSVFRIVQPKE
jgi:two-component system sensor histidine kinase YesM